MNLPQRKTNRLSQYDYDAPNAYFITICTDQRKNLLWENVGASIARPQDVPLSSIGRVVQRGITEISLHYPAVIVEHFVIMPNHVHLLLRIRTDDRGRPMVAPTISTVIQQMKGSVSKRLGFSLWQKGFHDHIVRGENDYREIWEYIESNPMKWMEDQLYVK